MIIDPSAASFKPEMLKRSIWYVDADDEVNEGIRITSMVLNQRLGRQGSSALRRKTFENTRSRPRCVSILRQERSSLLEAELQLGNESGMLTPLAAGFVVQGRTLSSSIRHLTPT